MNIKTKQLRILIALIAGILIYVCTLAPSPVQAQAVIAACKDKVRPEACTEAVKKECDKITVPDRKDDCIKNRANDFKNASSAGDTSANNTLLSPDKPSTGGDECGKVNPVKTRFNFGCLGDKGPNGMGPLEDLLYSFVRFLSAGIGIIVVFFIIISGIQYSTSEGNPEATQAAKNRIQNAVIGLFLYLIAYAFVQYLIPGGIFASSMIVPDVVPDIIRVIL